MILKRIFLILTLVLLQVACSGDSQSDSEAIRFGIISAPVTLDPRFATDATSSRINRLIYQQLVSFDGNKLPLPGIMDWQVINHQHYRFTLIKESTFHHGKKLTVEDIKATYDFILEPQNGSPHRNSLKHISKIVIQNEMAVDFYLDRPDSLFPAFLVVGIMPKDLLDAGHPFNSHPVGSGPFSFLQWPYEGLLSLNRRADQQQFDFVKVKDPTVRVLKLLRGEIDLLQNNLPPEHINYLRKQPEIVMTSKDGSNYSYIGFNLEDEKTGQLPLRTAIAYAIDRQKIIQYALGNAALPASSFFPATHWAGVNLSSYEYAPGKAREIMQDLGYSATRRLALTYKTSSDPFRIRIATIIQQQLKDIYIDIDIRSYDWGTFYGDIKQGKFQLYSLTWVGIKTPDIFRYVFHSQSLPPAGANRGRLFNREIDSLIEAAEAEQELTKQAIIYQKIQQKLHKLLPYVSLWYEENIAFLRQDITGYVVSADGNYDGLMNVKRI